LDVLRTALARSAVGLADGGSVTTYEPCGLCGDEHGVRFPVPGKEVDCVLCATCVRAAVTAHAQRDPREWAETRKIWEAEHGAVGSPPDRDTQP